MSLAAVWQVPQWEGSGSRRPHRLRSGAAELASHFPAAQRIRVDTADRTTAKRDGVASLDTLVANLAAIRAAIADAGGNGPLVVVGGDCGVDIAPVERALAAHAGGLAVVWFDAHGDLNTPASSPSGAFHGMVLRTLLGDGPRQLVPSATLRPEQVVLAGVRALDPGEEEFIATHAIRHVAPADLADPSVLVAEVAATGADAIHLHIDLDVLDPAVFGAVGTPEPDGLTLDELVNAVRALAARFVVAGLSVCEYEADGSPVQATLDHLATTLADVSVPAADPSLGSPGDQRRP